MLSSDKNIETIAQLVDQLKHYAELQKEYVNLDVIEKVVRLTTVAAMVLAVLVMLMPVVIFTSFAAAQALSLLTGLGWAYLIIAVFYLLLLVLLLVNRRRWIEKPLVKFLADLRSTTSAPARRRFVPSSTATPSRCARSGPVFLPSPTPARCPPAV